MINNNDYRQVKSPINSTLYTVQDEQYRWGVIDEYGNVVVPFNKYAWIDGFQNGLAKVISQDDASLQGIINEEGVEIVPIERAEVWKFYGKDFPTIRISDDNGFHDFEYDQIKYGYVNCLPADDADEGYDPSEEYDYAEYDDDYERHYEKYAGSYAQDVAGYDDDTIDDAFEGDPDLYWNID